MKYALNMQDYYYNNVLIWTKHQIYFKLFHIVNDFTHFEYQFKIEDNLMNAMLIYITYTCIHESWISVSKMNCHYRS